MLIRSEMYLLVRLINVDRSVSQFEGKSLSLVNTLLQVASCNRATKIATANTRIIIFSVKGVSPTKKQIRHFKHTEKL